MGDPKNMATAEAKDRLVSSKLKIIKQLILLSLVILFYQSQVRHILQLVADNTGFLVEDRLLKLIEKYPLTSRNLCTLDSIFMVKLSLSK